ncbi:probable caffeoyl-CoA O-methyltransferase 2 isoform X3 [Rosa chinensis]|uniref:probable caffeoyl-CoA O-methyltransferase 2 isoform X3 n=1 Tax=Rosa chinensis TaxID=74649 RepID=UPI000D0878CF|nr:probable caffeoyl-CoA O-methyltransferase 2 isoform X3 [Rosa chinensis]
MGSTSLGLHRWPILARQRVLLPQRSARLQPKFYSLSWERCHRGGIGFRACSSKLKKSIRGCATNAFVVADDKKYGNKQIISITPRLYDYILANVREPEVLRQLREETASMRGSMMQGYSSLAIALVLPESGRLVACERDARSLEVAKKYYEKANVSHKVDIRYGLAADTLRSLILNGEACSYDFAFVDADKRMYPEYFELLLQLVRVGGLIVFDNVLWHGKVADPEVNDAKTVSIRNFNADLVEDKRVSISMVPIGDGMTICRKS